MMFFATMAIAQDKPTLPSWFPPPNGLYEIADYGYRSYDSAEVPVDRKLVPTTTSGSIETRGRYWRFDMHNPKPEAWTATAEQLVREGFHFIHGDMKTVKSSASLQKGEGEHAVYVKFSQCCNSVYIVETAPNPFHVTLKPPAATSETSGVKDPIPYLPPLEGGKVESGQEQNRPMNVSPDCKGKSEPFGSIQSWRRYEGPELISDLAVRDAYEAALRSAGWEQLCEAGSHSVSAHFTKNGRDVWVSISPSVPREGQKHWAYEVRTADAGSGLRADLKKNCKASLYGVNFDFDKATLRPDAEPALNQLLAVLKEDPKLVVEIGGHTDNVGKPDYNMKLSDERAAAVRQWLVQHGIAANRLTSHGYGDTQPLVPNSNEENKAMNRRVEVKRTDCK